MWKTTSNPFSSSNFSKFTLKLFDLGLLLHEIITKNIINRYLHVFMNIYFFKMDS